MFGLHFIKSGIIDEAYGDFYSTLFHMRQSTDYEDFVEYDENDARKLLQPPIDLVQTITQMLSDFQN